MASEKQQQWHRYIDDYSEHYEVTNTDRERAVVGDGHLFRMGDKDDAEALVELLNALETDKATAVKALREIRDKARYITGAAVAFDEPRSIRIAQAALDALGETK